MGSLQNARIDQSYPGLIKTNDEAAIGAVEKTLQDGSGNNSTLSLGTASASFTGTLDLSGATVTGLPAGAAGLESGTGSFSMQSAASLTNTAANASGTKSVALGDNAQADNESVVIGPAASSGGGIGSNVAIGNNADCIGSGGGKVAIGLNATASGDNSVAVGNSDATGSNSVSLGIVANATNTYSLAVGRSVTSSGQASVAAGYNGTAPNDGDVNIGDSNSIATKSILPGDVVIGQGNNSSTVNGGENVLIGKNNTVTQNERNAAIGYGNSISRGAHYILGSQNTTSSQYQIGVVGNNNTASGESSFIGGHGCSVTARGAVALGEAVTASTAQTVSMKALELQTNSTPTAGGIIMSDAGGTDRRLNIDASGNLQIDSTPVGGGGGSLPSHPERYFGNGALDTTFEGPYTFFSSDAYFYAVQLQAGEEVTELAIEVGTAFTNTTAMQLAIYSPQIGTNTIEYIPKTLLHNFGTVDPTTTGVKTASTGTYVAPYTGTYFVCVTTNGQWDGTFRKHKNNESTYEANVFFTNNTTLGFGRAFNVYEPIRFNGFTGTLPASFAASQAFDNTSAQIAIMGKTVANI